MQSGQRQNEKTVRKKSTNNNYFRTIAQNIMIYILKFDSKFDIIICSVTSRKWEIIFMNIFKRFIASIVIVLTVIVLIFAVHAETINGTLVRWWDADPHLFFYNGKYYLTQTGSTRVAVLDSVNISSLKESYITNDTISYTGYHNNKVYDPTITELFGNNATINGTWSPEIHYMSETQFPGNSGWYMYLGLRKDTGDSSVLRMVVLKSTTDSPKGPYGHPIKGTQNHSQPMLDKNGNIWNEWSCGQTILTIPEGPYKGIYTIWIAEEGRGLSGANGEFFQKIMIAKLKSPWQLAGDPGVITIPTQSWEYAGADSKRPRVVEGATPVYGKNGEIFLTYSGGGYWSDYAIGQLTWTGGNPLLTSSWVKLPIANGNPIFSSNTSDYLRGAGHASVLTDTNGNGFFCYHAYKYYPETNTKEEARDAYIEPYYIDYTKWNGVSYGVIKIGLNDNGMPANPASSVTFATNGTYLTSPEVTAKGGKTVTLTMNESGATGYLIYKSTDNKTFNYLTTVNKTAYTDTDVSHGNTYYYRAYAYRKEEISDVSATVSAKVRTSVSAPSVTVKTNAGTATFNIKATDDYDGIEIYYSKDGNTFSLLNDYKTTITSGNTYRYNKSGLFTENSTYYVKVRSYIYDMYSGYSSTVAFTMPNVIDPLVFSSISQTASGQVQVQFSANENYDGARIYHSTNGLGFALCSSYDQKIAAGESFSITVDRLEGGIHYFFAKGIVNNIEYAPSETKSINVTVANAPSVMGINATCESILLTLGGTDEYDSYTIYRAIPTSSSSGECNNFYKYPLPDVFEDGVVNYTYEKIGTTSESTYTIGNVTLGEKYYFVVKGISNGISSEFSQTVIATPSHSVASVETLLPTCTDEGYTAYTYCEICETVISGKDVIPAIGHTYEIAEEEVPPTTESVGKTAVYVCLGCGDSYGGEEIPKLENPDIFTLAGDANDDGEVSLLDILRTLKSIVDTSVDINTLNADMDTNNTINITDVLLILTAILN